MASKPPIGTELFDSFSVFDRGMNSGIAAVLLAKNQMAFASNATVRGTYVKPRPPWQVLTLDFGGNDALQSAVTKGLWQCGRYYSYDSGKRVLIAAISGRLFEFAPGTTTATVREITGGNAQSAVAAQHWMVQAEFYLIWNDGINLPVFYNGNTGTTSRSAGNPIPPQPAVYTMTQTTTIPGGTQAGTVFTFNITPAYTGNVGDILSSIVNFTVTDVSNTSAIKASLNASLGSGGVGLQAGSKINSYPKPNVTVPQLPPGKNLAYIQGRVIVALTDGKQFIYGDIAGGVSGTLANNFRDAVIYCQENSYITGGGTFCIPGTPGSIRAFVETAVLDASFGQGPLQIHTIDKIYSCAVPTDRTTWQNTTNPILTVTLVGRGGCGQNACVQVNSDTVFRQIDGIGSFIQARRDFDTWGNVPISREVERIISGDDPSLLPWATAAFFDNRMLLSSRPTQSNQGIYHQGLIALNADAISSLSGKAPSVYDGSWPGINALQLVTGEFDLFTRCFAFTLDPVAGAIGLTEILPTSVSPDEMGRGGSMTMDSGITPITWWGEMPVLFHEKDEGSRTFKRLLNGELTVDSLIGQVDFAVYYRPDDYPGWVLWRAWSEGAAAGSAPQFRPRMGLGEPDPAKFDDSTGRPLREGYYFQVKVVVRGWCRIKSARFMAAVCAEPKFQAPKNTPLCGNPIEVVQ